MSSRTRYRSSSPSTSKRHLTSEQEDQSGCEYEVFLSFCGSDTRRNFTDFLYRGLVKAGIQTFRDDDELKKGQDIEKILEAIEHSKISIPVFSRNYASRKWCMRELAKMVECKKTRNQKILPIFYDVKPSVVRKQSGGFREALLKHEKKFRKETIQIWKEALREVSSLKGWVSDECFDGHQAKLVDDVVSTICKELMNTQQSSMQLSHTEVKDIAFRNNTDLILDSLMNNGVSRIGIYGLGGVGKTTLAMNVYDHLTKCQSFFGGLYWVTVSYNCDIFNLQSKVARATNVDLSSQRDPVLRRAKLLETLHKIGNFVLFLDDVWDYFPLEELGISGTESRCKLILTSRSLKVFQRMDCNNCFKVNPLPEQGAWNLFMEKLGNKMELSGEISQIAQSITKECAGLPHEIITMASSMKGVDDIREWRDCLRMLKEAKEGPESMEFEVYPVLKCSYDRLKDTQSQQCLLYCTVYPEDCSIKREELIDLFINVGLIKEGSVEAQLDRGHAILNKLENVCLLEGDRFFYVKMHDLIRDMALRISKFTFMIKSGQSLQEQPDAEDWSCDLEVVSLMKNEIKEISVSPKCPRLSTLLISENRYLKGIHSCFFEYLSGLKVLNLSGSVIEELSDSVGNMVNLVALILIDCQYLVSIPPIAKLSSLKRLYLRRTAIKKVPDGMENLIHLKYLDLRENGNLEKIPIGILPKLANICCFWVDWPKGDVEVLKQGELGCLQKLEIFRVWFRGWEEYTAFAKSIVKPNRYNVIHNYGNVRSEFESSPRAHKSVQLCGAGSRIVSSRLPVLIPEDVQIVWFVCNYSKKRLDELFQRNNVGNLEYCLTFSHLKSILIHSYELMERVFKVSFLSNLPNLEELIVRGCMQLQEIIEEEEEEEMRLKAARKDEYTISLPKLRRLHLDQLWGLSNISKRTLACDSLEELEIFDCPKLERIPLSLKSIDGRLSPPSSLRHIKIKDYPIDKAKGWWESLKWDIPDAKIALQPFVTLTRGSIKLHEY